MADKKTVQVSAERLAQLEALEAAGNGFAIKTRAKKKKVNGQWVADPSGAQVVEVKIGQRYPMSHIHEVWLDILEHAAEIHAHIKADLAKGV